MNDINFLAFSFVVQSEDGSEKQIAYCAKMIAPRKGEYVWMPFNWDKKNEFGTRAFIVEDVAHHIGENIKGTYDNIVVYCKPIIKK